MSLGVPDDIKSDWPPEDNCLVSFWDLANALDLISTAVIRISEPL